MKGRIKSITAKTYKDRNFYELVVEIGEDKTRKYSCWQNHAKDLKEGQEVEFTEESKEYTDNEGNTRTNWKMVLPGGAERKPWGGKSLEERNEIARMSSAKIGNDKSMQEGGTIQDTIVYAQRIYHYIKTGE